ncbi:MAG: hypothetical protein NXH82_08030 [Rhodobacteraceae bacterium]|nr:hypothetical protein [Paracoccaceae bacterium]
MMNHVHDFASAAQADASRMPGRRTLTRLIGLALLLSAPGVWLLADARGAPLADLARLALSVGLLVTGTGMISGGAARR